MGAPHDNARDVQTDLAADVFDSYARIVREFTWEEEIGGFAASSTSRSGSSGPSRPGTTRSTWLPSRSPRPVAAGCPVVLKPSDEAPLDAFLLGEVIEDAAARLRGAGRPGQHRDRPRDRRGRGASVAHPDIRAVSFTGSTGAGRQVSAAAAATIKRVGLELGGKSAAIVLDDVSDLRATLEGALADVFYNSGQTCTACTRILVPCLAGTTTRWRCPRRSPPRGSSATRRNPGDHLGPDRQRPRSTRRC